MLINAKEQRKQNAMYMDALFEDLELADRSVMDHLVADLLSQKTERDSRYWRWLHSRRSRDSGSSARNLVKWRKYATMDRVPETNLPTWWVKRKQSNETGKIKGNFSHFPSSVRETSDVEEN